MAVCLQDGVCQVFLDKGHVVVRAGNSEIRTQKTYNDENSHYLALYSNSKGYIPRLNTLLYRCVANAK